MKEGIGMVLTGVRALRPTEAQDRRMEKAMTVSLRESVDEISNPGNLDASVEEVFHLMLGWIAGAPPFLPIAKAKQ